MTEALVQMSDPERLARLIMDRGFRIREVAAIEEISLADLAQRIADPEVAANLDRLTATGYAAKKPIGPRELLEGFTAWFRDPELDMRLRIEAGKVLVTIFHSRSLKQNKRRIASNRRAAARMIGREIVENGVIQE